MAMNAHYHIHKGFYKLFDKNKAIKKENLLLLISICVSASQIYAEAKETESKLREQRILEEYESGSVKSKSDGSADGSVVARSSIFECPLCWKVFKSSAAVSGHMASHKKKVPPLLHLVPCATHL